jgi:hypothetical protein
MDTNTAVLLFIVLMIGSILIIGELLLYYGAQNDKIQMLKDCKSIVTYKDGSTRCYNY